MLPSVRTLSWGCTVQLGVGCVCLGMEHLRSWVWGARMFQLLIIVTNFVGVPCVCWGWTVCVGAKAAYISANCTREGLK